MFVQVAQAIEGYGGRATVKQIADFWEWTYMTAQRRVQSLTLRGWIVDTGERMETGERGRASVLYAVGDLCSIFNNIKTP